MKSPNDIMQEAKRLKNEKGQILLFVMVVLLLLMIIVFAVIVNVRVDIRETQIEREYEKGYSSAEEEIFKISVDGFANWNNDIESSGEGYCSDVQTESFGDYESYCSYPDFDVCCLVQGGSEGDKIIKRKSHNSIFGISIKQDETLEVNVDSPAITGDFDIVSWENAPAMSIMLVCRDNAASGEYSQVRAAVCRSGSGIDNCGMPGTSGFWSIQEAMDNTRGPGPLDLGNCPPGWDPLLVRFRAIGGDATNITIEHSGLPPQMIELRVQGFPAGLADGIETGLPGPELQTLVPIEKRMPSLFDYVLFVGSGGVSK